MSCDSCPAVMVCCLGESHAALPNEQPAFLTIECERVKAGQSANHARHEAGWPAAFEKAKSPDHYLALASMSGAPEVWYVIPTKSHADEAESMKRMDKDPVLSAETSRLAERDAQFIEGVTTIKAMARKDLSFGKFPDLAKTRFHEITTFTLKLGQDFKFVPLAKAYMAAHLRAAPNSSSRAYEVLAGLPQHTYLMMSSVEKYEDFDQRVTDYKATFAGATAEEMAELAKLGDVVERMVTNRYRVDPKQSYVPKETRESDPDFWSPK